MKELFAKRVGDSRQKGCAKTLVDAGLSIVKACTLTDLIRSSFYRVERDWRKADAAVIDTINAVIEKSPQAGFWKCAGRIKFKGYPFNHKRVYRVYCRMGLNLVRRVVRTFKQLKTDLGLPIQLRVDSGPELNSARLTDWCEEHNIELVYIQPRKPQQNGFVERFNRSFRREFLSA